MKELQALALFRAPLRCVDAEAYELSQGELFNGIFVSFLKRWLLEEEKITVLLDKVAEGGLSRGEGRMALPGQLVTPQDCLRAADSPLC